MGNRLRSSPQQQILRIAEDGFRDQSSFPTAFLAG
jgi:hypothetical protein